MTARSEDLHEDRSGGLTVPVLLMLLGFAVTLGFSVHHVLTRETSWEPRGWQILSAYAFNLLVVGAIWALSRLTPSRQKAAVLSVLLGFVALLGFSGIAGILKILAADNLVVFRFWSSGAHTAARLAANLLIFASAVWGFLRLKPWRLFKRPDEPISPATRKTQKLFGLSGLVGVLAVMVLMLGTRGNGANPVWSNSQNVSIGVAVVAIAIWLVSMALSWWWYRSADEHDRRANDVGFLAGGGLFMAVTPIWWLLWRAGLAPPPDAMVLWYATLVVTGIGWGWYRNR